MTKICVKCKQQKDNYRNYTRGPRKGQEYEYCEDCYADYAAKAKAKREACSAVAKAQNAALPQVRLRAELKEVKRSVPDMPVGTLPRVMMKVTLKRRKR